VAANFLLCDRDQELLLPPNLREWLPEDHLAWFVLDAVDELDLSAFYAAYREDGWGRAAFDPQMMVALKRAGGRSVQGYNGQVVASPEQVIIAAQVTQSHNDSDQLAPMVANAANTLRDAGSRSRSGSCSRTAATGTRPRSQACASRESTSSARRRAHTSERPPAALDSRATPIGEE
jgi:hypothetical protein